MKVKRIIYRVIRHKNLISIYWFQVPKGKKESGTCVNKRANQIASSSFSAKGLHSSIYVIVVSSQYDADLNWKALNIREEQYERIVISQTGNKWPLRHHLKEGAVGA